MFGFHHHKDSSDGEKAAIKETDDEETVSIQTDDKVIDEKKDNENDVNVKVIDGKDDNEKETDEKENYGKESNEKEAIEKDITAAASCWFHFKQLKIELVMFLYMFSYNVRGVTSTNMILDKVCLTHLYYPQTICQNLSHYDDIKTEVERMANNYHLGHSLIQILPSAILSCCVGPWSDRYGRKLPLIVAFIFIIVDGLGTTLCAHFMDSRVEYIYIPALFSALSGGFVSTMTVVYSYASDITTSRERTLKYAFLEVAMGVAVPAGSLVGGWLYEFSSYEAVFLTATSGHYLGLIFTMFALQETRGLGNTDNCRMKFKQLLSLEAFKDSFRTTMKRRPHNGRKQILLLLAAMSMAILTQSSIGGLMFLYVHHVYNWDNPTYSTVSAVYSALGMIAMLIAVPLIKRIRAGDPTLGIVGSVSLILKTVGVGIASKPGFYYLANFMGLLSNLGNLAARSRISKVVSKHELGKVFAFVTTAEMLGPIIATIVFSQVFNASLNIYPGMMFLICGVIVLFSLGVFVWLATLSAFNYEEIQNDQETAEESSEMDNEQNQDNKRNVII